jgi:hypothetical protein
MTFKIKRTSWMALFLLLSAAGSARSEGRAGIVGLSGDMGYYTYGMEDANTRYRTQDNSSFSGGLGYGAGVKLYLTDAFAGKLGLDYLFASKASSRTIRGVTYNTRVDLPATLLFLGGEYDLMPGGPLNLKLIGGFTFVNIYNGREEGTDGNRLDLGTVRGSGTGFQLGAGLEFFLGPMLSIETDLCYNKARIDGANFAGSPDDPNSADSNGSVDYSGMQAKVALTVYLGTK